MKTRYLLGAAVAVAGYFGYHKLHGSVDYNTEIKPLLNKKCIACHGGVKKAGGYSLHFRNEALLAGKSGIIGIIPGHAEDSEVYKRLITKDEGDRMPYHGEKLSDAEISLIKNWIDQGAEWGTHWAYIPVKKPSGRSWLSSLWHRGENQVDYFIGQKHQENHLDWNPEAERPELARRLSFDLIGMPCKPALAEKFIKEEIDYEAFVDSLLSQKAYGEKWATMWLDLARYADSRGYQKDNARNIWRYRDFVIKALNQNMPYDVFGKMQLAGDLINPQSEEHLLATAFHRNTMNNDETGTVDEEFRVAAVIDRVNTTYDAFLGTSMTCVQCHGHPYDPIKHEEYYHSMAYFNESRDEDTQDEAPFIRHFDAQTQKSIDSYVQSLTQNKATAEIKKFIKHLEPRMHAHYADSYILGALVSDRNIGLRNGGSCRLPKIDLSTAHKWLFNYRAEVPGSQFELRADAPNGTLLAAFSLDTTRKSKSKYIDISSLKGVHDVYLLAKNPKAKPDQDLFLINWFKFIDKEWNANEDLLKFVDLKTETTPIVLENPASQRRGTHVFIRGNWLVHGQKVQAKVPNELNPENIKFAENRAGLSEWIFHETNPLTARVMANRLWEQLFGTGLVETLEDFGTQGSQTEHQELLDYLAYQFKQDWDIKKTIKYLVMSRTYRQSHLADKDKWQKDPINKYLARGPKVRLAAEMIRDQALVMGQSLNPKMYGPAVLPYQPNGIWQAVNSSLQYQQSTGADNYRRAIYTFVRRTGPYPQQVNFDAPSREFCTLRRIRTSTPLQALQTLNDPVFVEQATLAASRLQKDQRAIDVKINNLYRSVFYKDIAPKKMEVLRNLYAKLKPQGDALAYRQMVLAMMNLDETLNK